MSLPQTKQSAAPQYRKPYSSCLMRFCKIRIVILLYSETAGCILRLRAAAMLHRRATFSAPTARGLLSTASGWIRLPTTASYLSVSATTSSVSTSSSSPGLLLPTPDGQGAVEDQESLASANPILRFSDAYGRCHRPEGGLRSQILSCPYLERGFVRCLCAFKAGT